MFLIFFLSFDYTNTLYTLKVFTFVIVTVLQVKVNVKFQNVKQID